jgi:hypothetical protein
MKNKLLILSLSSVFLTILFCNLVPAPGPNFHFVTVNEILHEAGTNSTLIAKLINDNFDACLVGFEYPDVGIFEYYTNFKDYAGTHNYNVPDEALRIAKNDRERVFAYCYKLHLAEDSVSHNFFVPVTIKKTKLPNYLVHPIQELKIEGRYLDPRANHMMEKHAEFDKLAEKATGRDWSKEAEKLNILIGGGQFYSKAYNPNTGTTWGKIQNQFYALLVKVVPITTEVDLAKLCKEEARAVLRGETNDLDPSGEFALQSADKETQLWLYVGSFIIIAIIFGLSFYFRIIGFSKKGFRER